MTGADPGVFDRGVPGSYRKCEVEFSYTAVVITTPFTRRSHVWGRHRRGANGGHSSSIGGVWRATPRKMLRFQDLKSAFWWILEMVLLCIKVKVKKPSGLIGGPDPPNPDPPPGFATG